jgi:tRNA threonylcarbamoyladenosine biosynthesis protein TsaB
MIDELLAESSLSLGQLDALAFGRGPGAFTGVRIATGVIQGLALSTDCPVVPVSTLAALAQGAISESKQIACALDARMGEVYWGLYQINEDNIMQLVGEETVCLPDAVHIPASNGWLGIGSGWETYEKELQTRLAGSLSGFRPGDYPSAEAISILGVDSYLRGEAVDAADAQPVYLRDKVTN